MSPIAKRGVPSHSPIVISPGTTRISTPTPRSPVPPMDSYMRDYRDTKTSSSYASKRHDSSSYSSAYTSDTSSYSASKGSSKYQSSYSNISSSKYKSDTKTSATLSGASHALNKYSTGQMSPLAMDSKRTTAPFRRSSRTSPGRSRTSTKEISGKITFH